MKPLEEIDPELIDQAVGRVCAMERAPDREVAISDHLGKSAELAEWVDMIMDEYPKMPLASLVYAAVAIGMEIGYQLGEREAKR